MIDPATYARDAQARDGTFVHVRAIRPDDRDRLQENFRRLSDETVYRRFLAPRKDLTEAELDEYTRVRADRHVGLVATVWEEGRERIVGVGRYFVDAGSDPPTAEVAFTVADEFQDRGVGTLLFDDLARIAHETGIAELHAETLAENRRMMGIFERGGLPLRRSRDGGVVHVHIALPRAPSDAPDPGPEASSS